jgi:hypothetical protein
MKLILILLDLFMGYFITLDCIVLKGWMIIFIVCILLCDMILADLAVNTRNSININQSDVLFTLALFNCCYMFLSMSWTIFR